jgi:uncharacterized membrane protein
MSVFPQIESRTHAHWLLLGSLALNLFFVGAAGAVAYRYSSPIPLTTVSRVDLIGRLNHLADTLPPGDAASLRAQLRTDEEKIVAARADLRLSRDDVRRSLRAEPFDADAMRKAMTANHTAHERFDQVIHETLASAASKMSVIGRTKLADWPVQSANARPVP